MLLKIPEASLGSLVCLVLSKVCLTASPPCLSYLVVLSHCLLLSSCVKFVSVVLSCTVLVCLGKLGLGFLIRDVRKRKENMQQQPPPQMIPMMPSFQQTNITTEQIQKVLLLPSILSSLYHPVFSLLFNGCLGVVI